MTKKESGSILDQCTIELDHDISYVNLTIDLPDAVSLGIVFEQTKYRSTDDDDPINWPAFYRPSDFQEDPFDPFGLTPQYGCNFTEEYFQGGEAEVISIDDAEAILTRYNLDIRQVYIYALENPANCIQE